MRILIHRLGSLGDTIVALPCFHWIRQTYPDAHIIVLTNSPVSHKAAPLESILENTGLMDGSIPYPMGLRNWRQLVRLHAEVRKQRFDLMISIAFGRHLRSSLRDYVFFKSCGIRQIVGLPWARRDRVCELVGEGPLYEAEAARLLRRAAPKSGINLDDLRWIDLKLTATEVAEAQRLLQEAGVPGNFIVSSQGTKSTWNEWGLANWENLYQQLSRLYPTLPMVLLGSNDERDASQALLRRWKGPQANFCGQASPRVSAAILRRARLFIGHDSGPSHLAAAAGTCCITIYSAYNPPGQWFPIGRGHTVLYPYTFFKEELRTDPEHQRKAIESIQVSEVMTAVRKYLDRAS